LSNLGFSSSGPVVFEGFKFDNSFVTPLHVISGILENLESAGRLHRFLSNLPRMNYFLRQKKNLTVIGVSCYYLLRQDRNVFELTSNIRKLTTKESRPSNKTEHAPS
jgi:hypothetical protein